MVIKGEVVGRKCSLTEGGACREDRMPKGGAHPGLADEFGLAVENSTKEVTPH